MGRKFTSSLNENCYTWQVGVMGAHTAHNGVFPIAPLSYLSSMKLNCIFDQSDQLHTCDCVLSTRPKGSKPISNKHHRLLSLNKLQGKIEI